MNQLEISHMPGAYEIAFCDQYKNPVGPWLWLLPRTLFDEDVCVSFVCDVEQFVTGIIDRSGRYRRIGPYSVSAGSTLKLRAGVVS
jgi:hypothetical protein